MVFTKEELSGLERRYRANLINSIGGFKSLVLVGTKSGEGKENLSLFSSLVHIGADPALCGLVVRPNKEGQNTLGNILRTGVYTINHVQAGFIEKAHQTSAKYPEGVSEFEAVGLTPDYVEEIAAPFVKESIIQFACELVQRIPIEFNQTHFIIGKITHVMVPDSLLGPDGFIDLESAGTITCSGLDSYHTTKRLIRLPYAKP
ncbi:flavin reductase [Flavihumibacter cheonanensis]|uniref:flavin reductase family protein n=1 Tax=Flavihumibacter cheonanensis TaxID=1442385 RepID=UPI001EF94FF6|nr:flavin reductase family protein [Flavihumibacter cheonanensis]MCG7752284.1 flavin reductase family protein [Flavihumibacter cheonanensis]